MGIAATSIRFDHGPRHRALLGVEAEDETRRYEQAGAVDLVHAVGNAAAHILLLAHGLERLFVGAFDADKDREEIRPIEHGQ